MKKEYKVTMKIIYEQTYTHKETSMKKTKQYFEKIYKEHQEKGKDFKPYLDDKPAQVICRVEKASK